MKILIRLLSQPWNKWSLDPINGDIGQVAGVVKETKSTRSLIEGTNPER